MPVVWSKDAQVQLANQVAAEDGINANHLRATINAESGWNPTGQSQIPSLTGPNGLEDTWGTCAINLPAHSDITKEQAQDPAFCIPWSGRQFAAGNAHIWTEWNLLYAKYGDGIWPE